MVRGLFLPPLVLVALAGASVPVNATVPGANGKIAFHSDRDGNWELYVMNADGSNQTRCTNNPAYDAEAAWSPVGSQIAFVSDRDGDSEIYVMNADCATGLTQSPTTRPPKVPLTGHRTER